MATGPLYDVFISYASGDVEWAAQLEADLIGKNVTVYRDKSRRIATRAGSRRGVSGKTRSWTPSG